jgi:hypothetical protein
MDEARIHATPGACGGSTPELGLGSERVVANTSPTPEMSAISAPCRPLIDLVLRFDSDSIVNRRSNPLLATPIAFCRLNRNMSKRNWICSNFPPAVWQSRAQVRRKSCGLTSPTRFVLPNSLQCARRLSRSCLHPGAVPSSTLDERSYPGRSPMHSTKLATLPLLSRGQEPCECVQPCPSDRQWPNVPPAVPGVRVLGRRLRGGADRKQATTQEAHDLACP